MKKKPTSLEQYLDENLSDIEPITAEDLSHRQNPATPSPTIMGQEWETETRSVPENPTDFEALTPAPRLAITPQTPQVYDVQDGMKTSTSIIICIISIVFLVGLFTGLHYMEEQGRKQADDARRDYIKSVRGY